MQDLFNFSLNETGLFCDFVLVWVELGGKRRHHVWQQHILWYIPHYEQQMGKKLLCFQKMSSFQSLRESDQEKNDANSVQYILCQLFYINTLQDLFNVFSAEFFDLLLQSQKRSCKIIRQDAWTKPDISSFSGLVIKLLLAKA